VSSNQVVEDGYFEEPQFFGGNNYRKGMEWYRRLFNESTKIILEKSANYFDNPNTPEAIYSVIPNAKIIILMIDPVERAYSWYQVLQLNVEILTKLFST
jgi:hypothetical protein